MITSQQLFIPLFPVAAFIVISAGITLLVRYKILLARYGGILMLAVGLDLVSYFLVLISAKSDSFQFSFRILVITYLFLVTTWLFFIFVFCGHAQWINRYTIALVGIIPLIMGVMVLTTPVIDPVWVSQSRETIGSLMVLTREFGWFGTLFIFYTFGIGFFSMVLLVQLLPTTNTYFRGATGVLFAGSMVIVFSGLLEVTDNNPFIPIASIQLGYALSSLLAFLFVFWLRAGGISPVARTAAFEHIQDGVLVLDRQDNVVDLNSAATRIIGQAEKKVIGKPLSQVWEQGADLLANMSHINTIEGEYTFPASGFELTFDVKISSVLNVNQERIGRTVVLRNVTGRERMEKALEQQTCELTRTNKLITALSTVALRLSSTTDSNLLFETLGNEIRKLDLHCGIVAIDPVGESATIKFVSLDPALIHTFERITGFSLINHIIPRRYWPGNRILKEKVSLWYSEPVEYLRRMFPQVPDLIAKKVGQALGIHSIGQICILPLRVGENLIGAMLIWGADLQPGDNPVLSLFAGQVAGILQSAIIHEDETRRANELARSNGMILALSKVASLLGNNSHSDLVLDTLGSEIRGLGLNCGLVTLDPSGEVATLRYLSFPSEVIQKAEKLAGISAKGYTISKRNWPDDRAIKEKNPVWYSDPRDILSGMFPHIPASVAKKVLLFLGFKPETQLCMLPLISKEQTIGAMLIWGVNLDPSDSIILAIFASQVAGILQNAFAYELEAERANELTRSNSLILALSKVASQLESSADSTEIFETVGNELKKLRIDSIIGILDDNKQTLYIKYISIKQDVIRWAEKMIGHSLDELAIPRHLWPTEQVVNEKIPYWDPNLMRGVFKMFPIIPESLHSTSMKMAGINPEDPVCYLPLANEHEVIGLLAVWGAGLKQNDISPLSILTGQLATAISNSKLYEIESRRAKELGILLEASQATSSSLQLSDVLLSLASKLLELSGFESCYISEWDKDTNMITGLIDCSRVFWSKEKRKSHPLREYSSFKEVLLTGNPVILQGDCGADEKQWMDKLGRSALIMFALRARGKTIGLVEVATTKKEVLFDSQALQEYQNILENMASSLIEPLSENSPEDLYGIGSELMRASGGEICSFSEWDRAGNRILIIAESADLAGMRQNTKRPDEDPTWKLALYEGKASYLVRTEDNQSISIGYGSSIEIEVESMLIFPLQKGNENIGLIELYDFNRKRMVTSEQIALLRTVADKASYSIQNARLLQQTQTRLVEKTALLNEKEVLLKEVHHRVKNNLQVISSLLNLQSSKISDPDTKDVLRESQNRVRTMALIHEKLYQSGNLAHVNFASYLQSLVNFLAQSYRGSSGNVVIHVNANDVTLDIDTAIPCGLIVNELVSNSLKYAFPEGRNGTIYIDWCANPGQPTSLRVTDDGVGLPVDFDLLKTNTLGLQLVKSLAAQLNGRMEVIRTNGTSFQILFNR